MTVARMRPGSCRGCRWRCSAVAARSPATPPSCSTSREPRVGHGRVGGAQPVAPQALAGRSAVAAERLTVETLALGLPSATLTASLTAQDLTGNGVVEGMIELPSLALDDLRKYWPPDAA